MGDKNSCRKDLGQAKVGLEFLVINIGQCRKSDSVDDSSSCLLNFQSF